MTAKRRPTYRVPKPRAKRKTPAYRPKPYKLQLGRTRHPQYTHAYETMAKLKAAAHAKIDQVRGDMQRWNPAGVADLAELHAEIDRTAIYHAEPVVIRRVIDAHTGFEIYLEMWKDPN